MGTMIVGPDDEEEDDDDDAYDEEDDGDEGDAVDAPSGHAPRRPAIWYVDSEGRACLM